MDKIILDDDEIFVAIDARAISSDSRKVDQ